MRRFCLCLFSLGVVAGATVASACSTTVAPEPAPVGSVVDAGTLDAQPNDTAAPEKGGVRVTVSGEDYATLGFDFTPGSATANGDPPAFVEGWQVRFSHVIVTVGNVRLNADPELDPKAYDKVGAVVESDPAAYAVDVVLGGSVVGKSGSPNEKTVAITTFPGKRLDPEKAYAFSYDTVAASANAKLVNLDAGGKDLYAEAIAKGYAMLYVEIIGFRDTRKTTVTGVEMFRKILDEGRAGENVGVLLRGIERTDVERGQILAKPGSVMPHKKFMGEVYVLKKEEGGRHTPFFTNYRPQFYMRTTDVTGTCELPEGTKMVMPGDNITMTISLIVPVGLEEQMRFAIREGGRTVGAGIVTKILE